MEASQAPLFSESQTFSPLIIRLVFLSFAGIFAYGILQQAVFHEPFGDKPAPTGVLVVLCLSMIGLGSFPSVTRLQTEITHDGIRYRFSPLQRTFVVIPFYEMRTQIGRAHV